MVERARSDHGTRLATCYELRQTPFAHDLVRLEDVTSFLKGTDRNTKGLAVEARRFMDSIRARKLRRYTKGAKHGLPPHQLYAVRDADTWDKMEPAEVARTYKTWNTPDYQEDDF
jgi:hypothetical protein